MSYTSPMPVKIGAAEQIVQFTFDGPTGVDAKTGKQLWKYEFKGKWPISNPTYLGNGGFFIVNAYGSGCAAFQVTPSGTQQAFKSMVCETQIPTPVFYKGFIYTVGNNNKAREGLMCMSPDGKVVWKTGRAPNFERGNMLMADGMLFVMGGDDGMLYLAEANPQAYKELAKAKVLDGAGKQVWGPMTLAGGHLLVRDQHELRCFDVKGK
jgi:outer membrane protein assembly factor BamB